MITKANKPKLEGKKDSELLHNIKEIGLDWIENPHTLTKTIYALIWLYFFIRVFITDLDLCIVQSFVQINDRTYVFGRALIFSSFILIYWHFTGNKKTIKNLFLLLFYPIYPVFFNIAKYFTWTIPKLLLNRKDSYIIYAYIDTLITNIVNIKTRLIKLLLLLIGIFILYNFTGYWLYTSLSFFCIIQLSHLYKRYNETFSPLKVFQMEVAQFKPNPKFSRTKFDEDVNKVVDTNSNNIDKKIAKMEYFLMIGEFAKVLQHKVSNVLDSRSYFKSFLFKGIYSFILAMVLFGLINYCLFKIDSSHFKFSGTPSYFEFFYYSFFTIFPDGSDIEPLSRMSKIVRMSGVGVGILVNLLIFIVFITVKSERYKENLQYLNEWAASHSTEVALYFEEKFGLRTAEGLNFLIESGSATAKYLTRLKNLLK